MIRKPTFGYLYDFRNPPQSHRPWNELYADVLDVVAWSEQAGFSGAWVPEHHLASDGYIPSPLVALSAFAARTKRITLGTGIALAPLYNPVRFATDAAVLDTIAGGRLELGLAIGYRKRETAAFGVDFTKRGKMFDEWLDVATRLWAGETVDHAGQFYQCAGARLVPPAPRGRMPLWLGGFADKAIARVVKYGDGYLGNEDVCLAYVERLKAEGRDIEQAKVRITGLMTVVARDPEAAMEELAPCFHHVNNGYAEWANEDNALGTESFKPMDLDAFKASGALQILKPEEAVAFFRGLAERMPLDHYMMMMPPGLPADRFVHYAQVFADEVLPAFR